jgi:hypothetical protein
MGAGSFLDIVHAPQMGCDAWAATFGELPHARARWPSGPGERPGQADNWIAADGTHVAIRVRLFGSADRQAEFDRSNPDYDARWEALAAGAVRDLAATTETYQVDEIELAAAPRPESAPFLYVVRMDVQADAEEEFNRWYTDDHIAGLSQVPGVYSARRFVARNASADVRKYLATYHLSCPSVRQTAAWQRASHTDWSIRIRHFHLRKLATMFTREGGHR